MSGNLIRAKEGRLATTARPRRITDSPGYLLKRAQAALLAALTGALREHGVTVAQYAVLAALDEEPGLSNAELARRAFVTPQTMNQVLRELEQKQWVSRHPHPGHGRILQAGLTQEGCKTLLACDRAVGAVEEQMLAGLSSAHRQQLTVALRTCIEALSQ
jgi:DNA-binding MarR family transcriptional regulator